MLVPQRILNTTSKLKLPLWGVCFVRPTRGEEEERDENYELRTPLFILVSSLAVIVMSIDGKLPGKERKPMKVDSDGINNTKIDHYVGMFAVYIGLGDSLYLSSGMGCFMDVNHDGLNANVANVMVRETLPGCINSSDDTAKPVQNGSINPKVVQKKDAEYRGCTDWY
ncbi:hypothetical protein Tco_1047253 [Tanacetum coccineum]